jgi:hypothetical protein
LYRDDYDSESAFRPARASLRVRRDQCGGRRRIERLLSSVPQAEPLPQAKPTRQRLSLRLSLCLRLSLVCLRLSLLGTSVPQAPSLCQWLVRVTVTGAGHGYESGRRARIPPEPGRLRVLPARVPVADSPAVPDSDSGRACCDHDSTRQARALFPPCQCCASCRSLPLSRCPQGQVDPEAPGRAQGGCKSDSAVGAGHGCLCRTRTLASLAQAMVTVAASEMLLGLGARFRLPAICEAPSRS